MIEIARLPVAGTTFVVAASERADGDVHPRHVDRRTLHDREVALTGEPWTMVDQVHGIEVVSASADTWRPVVGTGDVVVAPAGGPPVAVWAADCASLLLVDDEAGAVVGVHAGWRGLAAGIVDIAVDAVEADGRRVAHAVVGPCVRSCCYEFGDDELERVAAGIGVGVEDLRATTASGATALDMAAATAAALRRRGITMAGTAPCTGCDGRWFSHRRHGDTGRHATIGWVDAGDGRRRDVGAVVP